MGKDLSEFVFAEKSNPLVSFYDYDITISGRRGAGKSTFAIELFKDRACLFDVESSNKQASNIYKIVPKSWKEMVKIQREWAKAIKNGNKPQFDVLLFDTQTKLQLMCQEYVLDENGWDDFTQGEDGVNRWNALKIEYTSLMEGFRTLGFKIVRICHGKDKQFKPRGQEAYNQYTAEVGASFDYEVLGNVDFVFYLEKIRVKDDDGKIREARRLILQNDLDYDVKCRFPELPDEIVYDEAKEGVKTLFECWDEAVNKIEPNKTEKPKAKKVEKVEKTKKTNPIEKQKVEEKVEVVDDFDTELKEDETISIETLQQSAVDVRDRMLSNGVTRKDMIAILRDSLGTAKITECVDRQMLVNFIEAN